MADYNGVTLPELPADMLQDLPYAFIAKTEAVTSSKTTVSYLLYMLSASVLFIRDGYADTDADATYDCVNTASDASFRLYTADPGDDAWDLASGTATLYGRPDVIVDSQTYSADIVIVTEILWSNHNIAVAEVDGETVTPTESMYFAGEGLVIPPAKYKFKRAVAYGLADEIRRLADITDKLSQDDMLSTLQGVPIPKDPVLSDINITANGSYIPEDGTDGYGYVSVNVEHVLQDKVINENGAYTADEGYDGLGKVSVAVEPELEELAVTENGTYRPGDGVDGFGAVVVDVNVSPKLQDKTVAANGTVTADAGYDGLSSVTVNVEAEAPASTGLSFDSSASGCIPDYDHGYAESILALAGDIFTSSATGTVN